MMRKSTIITGALLALAGAGLAACGQSMDEVDKQIDKTVAEDAATASANAKAGADYLAQVARQPGVVTLPSGLMYKVLSSPDPKGAQPSPTDTVKINYEGKLVNGTVFDSSYARNEPAVYPLPRLVQAWQMAVPMMHKGDTWMLYVPPALGYGERDSAEIPANSVLIFKIQLLDINPKG